MVRVAWRDRLTAAMLSQAASSACESKQWLSRQWHSTARRAALRRIRFDLLLHWQDSIAATLRAAVRRPRATLRRGRRAARNCPRRNSYREVGAAARPWCDGVRSTDPARPSAWNCPDGGSTADATAARTRQTRRTRRRSPATGTAGAAPRRRDDGSDGRGATRRLHGRGGGAHAIDATRRDTAARRGPPRRAAKTRRRRRATAARRDSAAAMRQPSGTDEPSRRRRVEGPRNHPFKPGCNVPALRATLTREGGRVGLRGSYCPELD